MWCRIKEKKNLPCGKRPVVFAAFLLTQEDFYHA